MTSQINELENAMSCVVVVVVIIIIINVRVCLDQLVSFKARLTILQEVASEMKETNKMRKTNEESEIT